LKKNATSVSLQQTVSYLLTAAAFYGDGFTRKWRLKVAGMHKILWKFSTLENHKNAFIETSIA